VIDSISTAETIAEPLQSDAPLEVSIVMPCLNEERTVGQCVAKARAAITSLALSGEVLVVDNGSTDRSVDVATEAGARVVTHSKRGYGSAVRRGLYEARGHWILMGDCDESYDFAELPRFVERLRGGAELVMGNRLSGKIMPGAMPWLHRIGNPTMSRFLNLIYHTGIGDVHCGLRAMTKDAVRRMNLRMEGMEMASEMVIKSSIAGLRMEEIPITLWPDRRGRRPHLRSFRDGWRHLRLMLMCSPLFLFVLPGLFLTLLGFLAIPAVVLAGYGVFTDRFGPNFMFTAALLSITGSHLLVFGLLAKLYTHQVDPVFTDPRVSRFMQGFSVERGLMLGGVLVLTAAALGMPVIWHWWRTDELLSPARWISAGALMTMGVEVIFATFLVAILDERNEG